MTLTKLYDPKVLPAPARMFIRPMLFAALGLHALLLFTPLPNEQKPKKTDDRENPVKITQLPTAKPPASRPKVARPAVPKVNRPRVAAPVMQPATPAQPAVAANTQPQAAKDPFADFPHYTPSTPDCFNRGLGDSCRIANSGLTAVGSHFQKALPEKKYSISLVEQDGEKKIFEVSKGDRSAFLSLLSDGSTTVYVLAPEKVTSLENLKGAVVVPAELIELIGSLPAPDADESAETGAAQPTDFAQPSLFYKSTGGADASGFEIAPELMPGVDGTPRLVQGQSPAEVYQTYLADDLRSNFDTVSQAGDYGGGPLYQLKKGNFTGYLNVVPMSGQAGSIVVVWLNDPR